MFKLGLQQGFAAGDMGIDQIASVSKQSGVTISADRVQAIMGRPLTPCGYAGARRRPIRGNCIMSAIASSSKVFRKCAAKLRCMLSSGCETRSSSRSNLILSSISKDRQGARSYHSAERTRGHQRGDRITLPTLVLWGAVFGRGEHESVCDA